MRTTLDLEKPVLADLKRLARKRRRAMGKVASDLLAEALRRTESLATSRVAFHWRSKRMGARVDILDRDAVYEAMDGGSGDGR